MVYKDLLWSCAGFPGFCRALHAGGELLAAFQTPAVSHLYSAPLLASSWAFEDYTTNRAHPYLRKIETAGGWKAYEKAHRTKLLATFVPKFTHLVPKELVPLIVEFSFHVGFY